MKHFCLAWWIACVALSCNNESTESTHILPSQKSAALTAFSSCEDLLSRLRSNLSQQMRVTLEQQRMYPPMAGGGVESDSRASPTSSPTAGDAPKEGTDYSGTNNQEQGVDEADFTKTDGRFIYTLNGNRLEILSVPVVGGLTSLSRVSIEGQPSAMLQEADKLVVFSAVYSEENAIIVSKKAAAIARPGMSYGPTMKITVIDIADRATPMVQRELYMDGYFQTARLAGGVVRSISSDMHDPQGLQYWADPEHLQATINANDAIIATLPLTSFIPTLSEKLHSTLVPYPFTEQNCRDFVIAEDGLGRGVTSIVSFDLLAADADFEANHVIGNASTVYASSNNLYLVETAFDPWWYWNNQRYEEATNVHRFNTMGIKAVYTGSGRIAGTIQNQFSLSEFQGALRVAATTGQWGRWWNQNPEPPKNFVYVLEGENALVIVGTSEPFAEGERLWSSRFVEDKGYLVTFRNTDPLWTMDLSDKTHPHMIGELQVPGVSTYIHPIDNHYLLTIGYSGTETGLDWQTQVSLFDVHDFAHPVLVDKIAYALPRDGNWSYASSEAQWEHKAFQYWAPLGLLAIPLSRYHFTPSNYEYSSTLELIQVKDGHLSSYGSVEHSDFYNRDPSHYYYMLDIRRSIFMKDNVSSENFVYAISDRGVTANRLSPGLPRTAEVSLPGSNL
jgi:uncharacterized secreted protein with C-terminal beta-propeller domain